jgi:hypothetical protein
MQLILPDNMCHTKIVLKIEQPNGWVIRNFGKPVLLESRSEQARNHNIHE